MNFGRNYGDTEANPEGLVGGDKWGWVKILLAEILYVNDISSDDTEKRMKYFYKCCE